VFINHLNTIRERERERRKEKKRKTTQTKHISRKVLKNKNKYIFENFNFITIKIVEAYDNINK
jgi:hypothetical protein